MTESDYDLDVDFDNINEDILLKLDMEYEDQIAKKPIIFKVRKGENAEKDKVIQK